MVSAAYFLEMACVIASVVCQMERKVFCGRLDGKVSQFSLVDAPEGGNEWKPARSEHAHHTHDVRACVVAGNTLISAGEAISRSRSSGMKILEALFVQVICFVLSSLYSTCRFIECFLLLCTLHIVVLLL